ncbi:hypothetical protein JOD43_002247 [Pullulanibacillus pueri]|nr:hypothetical protein [Pullulanibacillus pueri]
MPYSYCLKRNDLMSKLLGAKLRCLQERTLYIGIAKTLAPTTMF